MAAAGVRWTKLAINKMLVDQMNLTLDFGLAADLILAVSISGMALWLVLTRDRFPAIEKPSHLRG